MSTKKVTNQKPLQGKSSQHWIISERIGNRITFQIDLSRAPDPPINFSANWVQVYQPEKNEIKIAFGQENPISKKLSRFYFIDIVFNVIQDWFQEGGIWEKIIPHCEKLEIDFNGSIDLAPKIPVDEDQLSWFQDRATFVVAGYNGTESELIFYRISPLIMHNANKDNPVHGEPIIRILMHVRIFADLIKKIKEITEANANEIKKSEVEP
jgi:hypothetical protein